MRIILDLICLLMLVALGWVLATIGEQDWFWNMAGEHRYLVGGLAFSVLGTLGEALAQRLNIGKYPSILSLASKFIMWGFHGIVLSLGFWLANGGVVMAQVLGFLPGGGFGSGGGGSSIAIFLGSFGSVFFSQPFFSSIFLNLGLILSLLAIQRLGEIFLVNIFSKFSLNLNQVVKEFDLADFIRREMVVMPLFRIPLVTLVFMQSQEMWIILAATLNLGLLMLMGFSGRQGQGQGQGIALDPLK